MKKLHVVDAFHAFSKAIQKQTRVKGPKNIGPMIKIKKVCNICSFLIFIYFLGSMVYH